MEAAAQEEGFCRGGGGWGGMLIPHLQKLNSLLGLAAAEGLCIRFNSPSKGSFLPGWMGEQEKSGGRGCDRTLRDLTGRALGRGGAASGKEIRVFFWKEEAVFPGRRDAVGSTLSHLAHG